MKAKVISIQDSGRHTIPGVGLLSNYQNIQAEIITGEEKGKSITIANDFITLTEGQKFYVLKMTHAHNGRVTYSVSDVDRLPWLLFFLILFIACVVIFGGIQGVRGLLSLFGGLFLIFYLLLPQIVAGASPLLISIIVSSLIAIVGSYITHGFNRTTSSAVVGMVITVVLTGVMAWFAVHVSQLTGFDSEEASYLSLNTNGALDLRGLLMGGIMIGLLGVLYDSAIGQAIAVEELWRAKPDLSRSYVYARALRIGREHIGALVNTLAIAYVGAALPLLVLFSFPDGIPPQFIINRELFATEIIRTLIGSIGLVLAIPITTAISTWMLYGHAFTGHAHEHGHHH